MSGECLEWALETKFPYGFIAGHSERQRKLLLKERERQQTQADAS